jgi:hypothetical protein
MGRPPMGAASRLGSDLYLVAQELVTERRSAHQLIHDQRTLQAAGQSSSLLTRLPRALRTLAHEAVVTEDRPHPLWLS